MSHIRVHLTALVTLVLISVAAVPLAAQGPYHLGAHSYPVTALGFSFDGETLASADAHGEIIHWNTTDGSIKKALQGHPVAISSIALSTHAERVATGGADGNMRLFNATTGERIFTGEGHSGDIHALAFSPDGSTLATAAGVFASQGDVVLWSGITGESRHVLSNHRRAAYAVGWSNDGARLASGGGRILLPGEVCIYNPARPELLRDFEQCDVIYALDFSPDGSLLAVGGREPVVYVHKVDTGELVARLPWCRGEIIALAFTPDGKAITSVHRDGEILVRDVESGEILASLCNRQQEISVAAFTADGSLLAFAGLSGQIQLWGLQELLKYRQVTDCTCQKCGHVPCSTPNIILIVADDLGYGDLGCYGQEQIQTPRIDALADDGLRLTNYYAGAPTGSPSRCTLMTGLHTGNCRIRGNEPELPLAASDQTVAELLRTAGYHTGIMGKWSLGNEETVGVPNLQGFTDFYGYLSREHAENYYPEYLWRNMSRELIPGNENGGEEVYSPDRITDEALRFIVENRDQPFFLYVPYTIVHANNQIGANGMQVPSDAPYSDENWPAAERNYAAMITRMDSDVGRIVDLLERLCIDEHTIVFITSDNGPHAEGGSNPEFFDSTAGLRGMKRDLYEGGIRVPMIVYWPRHVGAGQTSAEQLAHWDFLPTAAELTGARLFAGQTDGRSWAALLGDHRGRDAELAAAQCARCGDTVGVPYEHQPKPLDEFERPRALYWETHEPAFAQAILVRQWKAIRHGGPGGAIELYNLAMDPSESENVAGEHPEMVRAAAEIMDGEHIPSPDWPAPGG